MTASNEQRSLPTTIVTNSPRVQNGKISHVTNRKMEEKVAPNKVNRESSISLIIPLINGEISSSPNLLSSRVESKHYTTERKRKEEDDDINYIDTEQKERYKNLKLRGMKPKYVKISKIKNRKHKTHVFWKTIYPFSISDRFEKKVEIIGNKCDKNEIIKRSGFLYSFVIEPHAANKSFAIFTPKEISNELELNYIKFRIHYPEFAQCEMHQNCAKTRISYKKMSSNIKLVALNENKKYELNNNEYIWLLEFNHIMFKTLDSKLSHCSYCMQEIPSFDTKNYLISPLLNDAIDWKLIQNIVKHHYNKVKQCYDIKHLVTDLRDDTFKNVVLYQNGSYFVPLNASKQRNIKHINALIDEYKDLNEMQQLLDDDDDFDENKQIMDKIGSDKISLLCLRFDSLNDFITNITDSFSFIFRNRTKNTKNASIIEPKLDLMDIGRDGVFRAPFDRYFFYTMIKIPFILFQFERIFGILHFMQSQQCQMRWRQPKKSQLQKKELFWIKIPFLTLSKIMFCETISVQNRDLFQKVGKEIVTLIYCTSSLLSLLSSSTNMNMIKMTAKLMNEAACKFRKHLSQNRIFDYLCPSLLFRQNEWKPARFVAMYDVNVMNDSVNKYISSLLYPSFSDKESRKISHQYLFGIQNDLFSSLWYYNYANAQIHEETLNKLFVDCCGLMEWMKIDQILYLSHKRMKDIENNLHSKHLSNEYALFEYLQQTQKKSTINIKNSDELAAINKELQSVLCRFVRDIDYKFVYPTFAITAIDPFNNYHYDRNNKIRFELLYDLGNIVLNFMITLFFKNSSEKYPLLLYKKCLTSTKYLSYQCKYHSLNKHIHIKKNKLDNELMAAFIVAIIGAIYLDSNLNQSSSSLYNLAHVYRFIKRYLAEIILGEQQLEKIIYLFKNHDDYPPD